MEYVKCNEGRISKYPVDFRLSTKRGKIKLMGAYEIHRVVGTKLTVELVWRELIEHK
jgi:hypothetical protein